MAASSQELSVQMNGESAPLNLVQLEQAFNHSPNITQAEKYQLAEVTGLKPKQVTIWVSSTPFRRALCVSTLCRRVLPLDDDDQFPQCEQYCG